MKIGSVPSYAVFVSTLVFAVAASAAPRGDTDGDGKLSLSEFQARMQKRLLRSDKNGDGKLSLEEWLARPAAGKGKADPSKIFKRLDANGDGFLDAAEIDALAKRRFDHLDANADGSITDEELSKLKAGKVKDNSKGAATDEKQPAVETGTAKN